MLKSRSSLHPSRVIKKFHLAILPAKGWAWFKPNNDSLWYKIDVTGLDTVMEVHMHMGKNGQNGDPAVMLFHSGPTGALNGTLIQGSFTAD